MLDNEVKNEENAEENSEENALIYTVQQLNKGPQDVG